MRISSEKLNKTLLKIIKILNDNDINNWFIGYGTLLGIIREKSCINGDDDVDIIIDKKHFDKVEELLIENNFQVNYDGGPKLKKARAEKKILNTKNTNKYSQVDFYMSIVDKEGNFEDLWENIVWSKCYNDKNELIEYIWNENKLYLPNNYKKKLANYYGEDWEIPKKYKGAPRI